MDPSTSLRILLGCSPGLEQTIIHEITRKRLNCSSISTIEGGVECNVENLVDVAQLSLVLGTPESVRLRLGTFKSENWLQFEQGLLSLHLNKYFGQNEVIKTAIQSTKSSTLYHTSAIRDRIATLLQKHHQVQVEVTMLDPLQVDEDAETQTKKVLYVRIDDNVATISTSVAQKLYRRNPEDQPKWISTAPLRETIAASLLESIQSKIESQKKLKPVEYLRILRPTENAPLPVIWDPFCGSGTILTEAIRISQFQAINRESKLDLIRWPSISDELRTKIHELSGSLSSNIPAASPDTNMPLVVLGCDREQKSFEAVNHNMSQLLSMDQRLASRVDTSFENMDFEKASTKFTELLSQKYPNTQHRMTVISNLPYGHRLNDAVDIQNTFVRFGKFLKRRQDIKQAFVLNGHPKFQKLTGLKWEPLLTFKNRGIPVQFLKMIK